MLEGTPPPSRPGTSVSLSPPLPCTSYLNPPCLSFPPLLYNSPCTPNRLIPGRSKALLVDPWERGREGRVGGGRKGGRQPLSQIPPELRWVTAGRLPEPFPLPILRGTTATPFPRGTGELGESIHSYNPPAWGLAWLSPALFPAVSPLGSHGRGRSRPFPQHGRGGGAPGGGGAEEDAGIGRQRDD